MDSAGFSGALKRLASAVSGKMVVPRVPDGARLKLPPTDSPEVQVPPEEQPAEPFGLLIRYVDAKGAESVRRITLRQMLGVPPTMILAFCHERQRPRHFRLDRIKEVACAETGEIYAPDQFAALLAGEGLVAIPLDVRRAVNVLVFLMRCDAIPHPAEWQAIDQALAGFILRFGGDDAAHGRALELARQVAPDANDFLIGMRSFASSGKSAKIGQWLRQAVLAVIDADGYHSAEEFAWMTEVTEFLDIMRWKSER